jgi:hypothetical protein
VAVGTVVRTVVLALWAGLAAVALALEVAGRRRIAGLAPLGEVLWVLCTAQAARLGLFVVWAWLGWHLFAR